MDGEVVARSTSRRGGNCADCREYIRPGALIVKIADSKRKGGANGPGRWVGICCAPEEPEFPNADADHLVFPLVTFDEITDDGYPERAEIERVEEAYDATFGDY